MLKKFCSVLLSCVVATAMLAGCAQKESTPPLAAENEEFSGQTSSEKEVIEVRAVLQLNPEISLENNPVLQKIEEDLGIRLIVEAPPLTSYSDRVKVLVGTGDMPDFFAFGADNFAKQWAEEALLADVTDLLSGYKNLSENISNEQYGDTRLLGDDHVYGVPRPNSYDKWGFVINKKWLDKLGLKAPETIDEFVEVCRAFTNDDPDGNGVADTYGASLGAAQNSVDSGVWHLDNDFISTAYGISSWHHGLPDLDGSAKTRSAKSGYYEYLTLLRDMYKEKIIDREFITHKNAGEDVEKFAQGRVGIVGASGKNYITQVIEKYSMNPDDVIYCKPLVRESGEKPVYVMPPSNWMAYFINAKSEKIDAVLRLLDWANSEEGFTAMQVGLQGIHYNSYDIENRTIDRSDEQAAAVTKVTGNMFGFANAYKNQEAIQGGSTPELTAKWQEEEHAADQSTRKCFTPFVKTIDRIVVEFPDDAQALSNLEVRYVTGETDLSQLKKFNEEEFLVKIKDIEQELQSFMQENPVRYEE